MGNPVKNAEQIELLRENNLLVSKTLAEVAKVIGEGVTGVQIDKLAEEFIRDHGAKPGFLGYDKFPNTLCVSVNNVVIHGIPNNIPFKDGDIVSVDCGTIYKGFVGDSAYTFTIGNVSQEAQQLVDVTRECLKRGVAQAVAGKRIGDISNAVQSYAESFGYGVVRDMVGHGIGTKMHEKPEVPNFGKAGQGKKLLRGMVICIEPMITMGSYKIFVDKTDKWSLYTHDGSWAAHFEYAVAIGATAPDILTTYDYIEAALKSRK
ncbi:methionine aminopeptidase [Bacteroidia bacterium]|nr:methionine aminopeptidase [Bacteroidia bacterium]